MTKLKLIIKSEQHAIPNGVSSVSLLFPLENNGSCWCKDILLHIMYRGSLEPWYLALEAVIIFTSPSIRLLEGMNISGNLQMLGLKGKVHPEGVMEKCTRQRNQLRELATI